MSKPNRQNKKKLPAPCSPRISPQQRVTAFSATSYRGDVPMPSHVAEFEKILPGAAKMLFEMAKEKQQSEINCNSRLVAVEEQHVATNELNAQTDRNFIIRGQIFGFVVLSVVIAVFLILLIYAFLYSDASQFTTLCWSGVVLTGILKAANMWHKKPKQ
jgi:uncharacterized membrane protein